MNRSFKVLVVTMLALSLSLSFGSAFAKKENKPPKAPKPTVTSIDLSLIDRAGTPLTQPVADTYTVVTGQKYVAKASVLPEGIKTSLRWRSSRHGVANVDNRGNIHTVRPGTATISVANKNGTVKKSIILNVQPNIATFNVTEDKAVQKIYLKGKYLYIDVLIVNNSTETLATAPDLKVTLTLARGTSPDPSVKSGRLRREIPAGGTGTAVYKIMKVDPRTIWLLDATASCVTPT